MKAVYLRRGSNWNQPLLCVTHTDRPVDQERCSLNFLEMRYAKPDRLPATEPFATLGPARQHSPHLGEISIWEMPNGDFQSPRLIAHLRPGDYKPQFVIWYRQRLWVLGTEILEVYDASLSRVATIKDPWLAAAHTIVPDNKGNVLVSCSASDSVLVIDENRYEIKQALRMPDPIYGTNYHLTRTDSVVDHYIGNDLQTTHINCAWPWRNGILTTALIQGALGWFNANGEYQELLRGYVGCHGGRPDTRNDQIYFSDSCLGAVVFMKPDFTIAQRIATGSIWLHDAHQLHNDVFALSIADRNQVEIMDISCRETLARLDCRDFGSGTQFIYYGA